MKSSISRSAAWLIGSRPRSLVARHQRVGNRSSRLNSALLAPAGLAHMLAGAT
jgi:hypothetical protein